MPIRFRISALIAVLLLCALIAALLLSCNGSEPAAADALVRRLDSDVSTLNPLCASREADQYVHKYLFTPLIDLDRKLEPMAGLATEWNVSPDGRIYTFRLDPKATFSDGTPVRASDVVFTLKRIADKTGGAMELAGAFSGLNASQTVAVDDRTVRIVFDAPLATQLSRFADVYVVPERVYRGRTCRGDDRSLAVTGSGPYRLDRLEGNRTIVLERREDYWADAPQIKRVLFRVIDDDTTAWNALGRGDIDETVMSADLWTRASTRPGLRRQLDFRFFYTINYSFIAWNTRHPILGDERVRRALAMCIPVDTIIETLHYGAARPVTGPFTPDQEEYDPAVPRIPYDPDAAKRALAAIGWIDRNGNAILDNNGRELSFRFQVIAGAAGINRVAQIVKDELRKIDVAVTIETFDGSTAFENIYDGNYDATYMAWNLDAEPDLYSTFHSSQMPRRGQNIAFYANPEADRLIEQARVEMDAKKRVALYRRLHALLAADQPYTWVVQSATKWATSKRLQGIELSADGPFLWNPGEFAWRLAPK